MEMPTGAKAGQPSDAVTTFVKSSADLHVDVRLVMSQAELSEALRAVLSKAGAKSVVVAGIPERYLAAIKAGLSGLKVDFVEDLISKQRSDVVRVLAAADAGVTWAVNGVALEAALLEVVYDDSFKLASCLPMIHVALVEASTIVPSMAEALPIVGGIVAKAPQDKKPVVSFIAGPSKTGDIEMRLLYGVHGPHTVCALVLGWR